MLWYPRIVFEKIQKIQKSVQRSTSVWYLFIENQWACSKIVEFICVCDSDIFVYLFVHIYFHRLKQWKDYIYVVQFILFLSLLNYILCCCHFWSNHFTIYNKDTSSFFRLLEKSPSLPILSTCYTYIYEILIFWLPPHKIFKNYYILFYLHTFHNFVNFYLYVIYTFSANLIHLVYILISSS